MGINRHLQRHFVVAMIVLATLLCITELAIAFGVIRGTLTAIALGVPLLLTCAFYVGLRAPVLALVTLFVTMCIEGIQFTLFANGGVRLRFDELIGPALLGGVLAYAVRDNATHATRAMLRRVPGLVPLGLFLLFNLIPTLLVTHERQRGISLWIILVAGAATYMAVVLLAQRDEVNVSVLRTLIAVAAIEGIVAISSLLLAVVARDDYFPGAAFDNSTLYSEAMGTMFEPNFLGGLMAAASLIAIALIVHALLRGVVFTRQGFLLVAALSVTLAAMLASFTRGSWLAFALGCVVLVILWVATGRATVRTRLGAPSPGERPTAPPRVTRRLAAQCGVALALPIIFSMLVFNSIGVLRELPEPAFVAALISPHQYHGASTAGGGTGHLVKPHSAPHVPLLERIKGIFDTSSGSGYGRVEIFKLVLQDWHNPIIGMGDGSFNLLLPQQVATTDRSAHPWIYSMFLAVLHDAGILGFAAFLWLLGVVYAGLLRTLRTVVQPTMRAATIGTTCALTALLIAGQTTTSLYLMLFWIFLGLAAAMPVLAARLSPASRTASTEPSAPLAEPYASPAASVARGAGSFGM